MCNIKSYFHHFCGKTGKECACHGHHAKSYRCMNAVCGKMFKSKCGAQLFCSLECQMQTCLGLEMFQMVEGDRILNEKKERRRRQVRSAVQKYKGTTRGKEINKNYNRNRRIRLKESPPRPAADAGMCR